MQRKIITISLVPIGMLIAAGHFLGTYDAFYWSIGWWDTPMHFLGGFFLGLVGMLIFISSRKQLFLCVIFALAVGLAWEGFELSEGLTVWGSTAYYLDTLHDVVCDSIGAAAAWYVFAKIISASVSALQDQRRAPILQTK